MKPNRYIRQTSLKDFGDEGQRRLSQSRVLVVGAGGLGIPVLQYLTAMGVGTIGIVENDTVDISNLQRQVIYSESDIGKPKIYAILNRLKNLNGNVEFLPFKTFLTKVNALKIIEKFDVVVDATDNFPTRYLINDACVILNKPYVYGALHAFEGQISVFNYEGGPTYRCLYPKPPTENEIPDCNENGVLGVIPGIIGTLQALEVVKVVTDIGEVLSGRLLLYDGLRQEFQNMNFKPLAENKKIEKLQSDYGFESCDITNSITAEEFLQLINTDSEIELFDVRSKGEFKAGHINGAVNFPIENIETELQTFADDKKAIYIICQSGKRSQRATQYLQLKRPDLNVINVEGGYNALETQVSTQNTH